MRVDRIVRRIAAALLSVVLVSGCAAVQRAPTVIDNQAITTAWAERQRVLAAVRGFQLNGRVAVKGGGLSGALRWQQDGEHFSLRIAGPFGAGALSMEGTPALVAIRGKDIDLVTTEAETVLAQRTGWRLPLDSLRWWVLGTPDPALALGQLTLDDAGQALQLQQAGWTLRYSDYHREPSSPVPVAPPALPRRIEASQRTAAGEWMATVVLESLTLTP